MLVVCSKPGLRSQKGNALCEQIQAAVTILKTARQLKEMQVLLTEQTPYGITPKLAFENGHSGIVQVSVGKTVRDWHQHQFLLEPLAQLYDIPQVTVSGCVDPLFAAKLASIMEHLEPTTLETSPLAGRTQSILRRRPYRARKHRVEQPLLRFWEPKFIWDLPPLVSPRRRESVRGQGLGRGGRWR